MFILKKKKKLVVFLSVFRTIPGLWMKKKKNTTIKYVTNCLINITFTLDEIMNVNILRPKMNELTDIVYNYFLN